MLSSLEGKWGTAEGRKRNRKGDGNKEERLEKEEGGKEKGEMINPIKPLSVSSIAIVLRWLPFPQLAVGCS